MDAFLPAGEFVTVFGVQGQLKLYPWADIPLLCGVPRLYTSAQGGGAVSVQSAREHKNMCVFALDGVTTVEQARGWVGKTVYFARADVKLPKGKCFVQDIIGCTVQDADSGKVYGTVTAVTHPAAHDVYEVRTAGGKVCYFPAVKEFLSQLCPQEGKVLVRPIAGMFEDEAENVDERAAEILGGEGEYAD